MTQNLPVTLASHLARWHIKLQQKYKNEHDEGLTYIVPLGALPLTPVMVLNLAHALEEATGPVGPSFFSCMSGNPQTISPSPSHLTHFLKYAEVHLGVRHVLQHKSALETNGIGPATSEVKLPVKKVAYQKWYHNGGGCQFTGPPMRQDDLDTSPAIGQGYGLL
ncbi:hypothetical protein BDN67DRAFT_983867 [Paxillus ammoniavirescens]|nr:hypothetical protein BDN67DRAFT_983867 [Paxillus ammoniavirescens]